MRYAKIESHIWADEKFAKLTHDEQLLFLYLLTCPHSNLIGLFVLKPGYSTGDLRISEQDFSNWISAIKKSGLILYDRKTCLIWIKNFLRHNPLTNPNQKKAAISIIKSLPKSYVIKYFLNTYEGLNKGLNEGLDKGLNEGLSKENRKDFRNQPPIPIPNHIPPPPPIKENLLKLTAEQAAYFTKNYSEIDIDATVAKIVKDMQLKGEFVKNLFSLMKYRLEHGEGYSKIKKEKVPEPIIGIPCNWSRVDGNGQICPNCQQKMIEMRHDSNPDERKHFCQYCGTESD